MFKIRNHSSENYDTAEQSYRDFLSKNKEYINLVLWKYFSNDFFHDGEILNYNFDVNRQSLEIQISAPNIVFKDNHDYIPTKFTIKFHEIKNITWKYSCDMDCDDGIDLSPMICCPIYLYSEIGSIASFNINEEEDNPEQSIIIQILRGIEIWSLSIIFMDIDVIPDEALTFEYLIQQQIVEAIGLNNT